MDAEGRIDRDGLRESSAGMTEEVVESEASNEDVHWGDGDTEDNTEWGFDGGSMAARSLSSMSDSDKGNLMTSLYVGIF